jgi:hypothetical protein
MQYFGTSLGVIVKGKCKQRWSTIPPILVSIKGTTISCLRSSIELKKKSHTIRHWKSRLWLGMGTKEIWQDLHLYKALRV